MSEPQIARVSLEGDVAVISVNNPPVNTITASVRSGLRAALAQVAGLKAAKAVLLRSARAAPSSRAPTSASSAARRRRRSTATLFAPLRAARRAGGRRDARHGDGRRPGDSRSPATTASPRRARASACPKSRSASFPGAGGTQRMPRLIGVEKALELMLERAAGRRDAGACELRLHRRGDRRRSAAPARSPTRAQLHRAGQGSAPHRRTHGRSGDGDRRDLRARCAEQARKQYPNRTAALDGDRGGAARPRGCRFAAGSGTKTELVNERQGDAGVEGRGPRVLRRARDAQGAGPAGRRGRAPVKQRRHHRRRHDGRRHRDLLRQRRHPGDDPRREPRGARRAASASSTRRYESHGQARPHQRPRTRRSAWR